MIERYTNPEMGSLWKDQNRYRTWLDVEIAVCEAWAKLGKIPAGALKTIKAKAGFDAERIDAIEKVVKHDIIAFLTSVNEKVGPDGRFIHMGLTSYDVVDTALSMMMRQSLLLVRKRLVELKKILRREAVKHKKTVCMGRTHGIHAEPVTFGFKILVWYEEIKRHLDRVDRAIDVISRRPHLGLGRDLHPPQPQGRGPGPQEARPRARARLDPGAAARPPRRGRRRAGPVATSLEKFTLEIRHLQKSEVLELEEPFTKGQKGSSSMPHKKNPVRCERMAGLARLVRGNVQVALENIPLWHERDISHSSAERIILPDSFILTDYMLTETIDIIGHWVVHKDRMRANIDATRGLTFSQSVLLALTRKGLSREDAYALVQRNSLKAWNENGDFKDLAAADPDIAAKPSRRPSSRPASPSSLIWKKSTTSLKGCSPMKVRILVSFKDSVLDPQGQTVRNALHTLGYDAVQDVRQGKVFEVELAGVDRAEAEKLVPEIAGKVLANLDHREIHLADPRGLREARREIRSRPLPRIQLRLRHHPRLQGRAGPADGARSGTRTTTCRAWTASSCPADSPTATTCGPAPSPASRR